jgi:cyclopropane-fatty-acyl-phospholipid synthase
VTTLETADTGRWPGLSTVPSAVLRAWLAERLFRLVARKLEVRVVFPDGEEIGRGGPVMRIVRPSAFFHRLGADAKIGFGEAYMAGDWTTDDPAGLLTPFAARAATMVPKPLQAFRRWVDARKPSSEDNSPENARANIHRHYDLSNDLFAAFLDKSMTYSSAWFGENDDLASAQHRKIDGILDYAGVGNGTRLLEIGTGWGALAVRAAERGADVTSLTISTEQAGLARRRIAQAALEDRARVLLRDYREAEGRYDAIVSVEMIEAVGRKYWPVFFGTLDRLLAPGGRAGLQAITMPHDRMLATSRSYTWIHKYVFPGGHLLSIPAIEDQISRTTLRIGDRRRLGDSYARTLHEWRTRFHANEDLIATLGFDEIFHRLWEFYLAYSEAGFRTGYLDVWQLQLHKPAN